MDKISSVLRWSGGLTKTAALRPPSIPGLAMVPIIAKEGLDSLRGKVVVVIVVTMVAISDGDVGYSSGHVRNGPQRTRKFAWHARNTKTTTDTTGSYCPFFRSHHAGTPECR